MKPIEGLPEEINPDNSREVYRWFTEHTDQLPPQVQKRFFKAYLEHYPEAARSVIIQVVWTTSVVTWPELSDDQRSEVFFRCSFEEISSYLIFATT